MTDRLHPLTHVIKEALGSPRQQRRDFPHVIEWACPVPFFGHAERARIASVGINPSDKEFCDNEGGVLNGSRQRLATLDSLRLQDWSSAGSEECSAVAQACSGYFESKPYWRWFNPLEAIFEDAGRGTLKDGDACHVDLAPWATHKKWRELGHTGQTALVECGEQALKALLESAQFDVLLLNGASVVKRLARVARIELPFEDVAEWRVRGASGKRLSLKLDSLGSVELGRLVTILGWNWNLQSPIPKRTRESIAAWAARGLRGMD